MAPPRRRKGDPKASKVEAEARTEYVFACLLSGMRVEQIRQNMAQLKNWHLSLRQVGAYATKARERLRAMADVNLRQELGTALARLDDLANRALAIADYATALNVQKERSRLLGLAAPTRIEAHVDVGPTVAELLETLPFTVVDALAQAEARPKDARAP